MFTRIFGSHASVTNSPVLWQICHQSCQQRRNSGPFTTQVLEDSVVLFWLYFGVLGMIHRKLQIFFQMFSQISRTPDFEQNFRVKRCGLYAGVYGIYIHAQKKKITQKQLEKVQNTNTETNEEEKAIETVRGYKFWGIEWQSYQSYRQWCFWTLSFRKLVLIPGTILCAPFEEPT